MQTNFLDLKRGYASVGEPVSILLPVCNEAEGIESVVAELVEVVYRYLAPGSEFLIEEGGSTDGTKEILQHLNERWPFLAIRYSETKEGFGAAARNLYRRAKCPLVFFTDSDGQCVASEFWKFVPNLQENLLVLGVKRTRHDPVVRRVLSRGFNWLVRRLLAVRYRDINFGFRLCRREALLLCLERCREMPTMLNAELVIHAIAHGLPVAEVTVHHRPRLYGMRKGFTGPLVPEAWAAFLALLRIRRQYAASEPASPELERHP